MGDTEKASDEMMQRLQSSFGSSSGSTVKQQIASSQQLDLNHLSNSNGNASVRQSHFTQSFGGDCGKRVGVPPSHPNQIPPISPYSQMPSPRQSSLSFQNFGQVSSHSRSLSQPSFDSLPPLSPSLYHESSSNVSDRVSCQNLLASSFGGGNYDFHSRESLPPSKTHRRSVSDSAFGFSALLESSMSPSMNNTFGPTHCGGNTGVNTAESVKSDFVRNGGIHKNTEGTGERKSEGEVINELFSAYMNLDSVENMKSSESNDKSGNSHNLNGHGGDSSDNETVGSINETGNITQGANEIVVKKEGMKRSAAQDITPSFRNHRSISMDSFMGGMDFGEDSLKLSPRSLKVSPSTSTDKNLNTFSLEFRNGEFSREELKKIMADDKLAEMALVDPKRVKRILANRLSAARSKERKMRYNSELEHKVQTLQSEVTTLSTQVTGLQRDSVALTSQNNELRFRLQAMEQQAQLRDTLNETLHGEVQTLRLTTQQLGMNSHSSKGMPKSHMIQAKTRSMKQYNPE